MQCVTHDTMVQRNTKHTSKMLPHQGKVCMCISLNNKFPQMQNICATMKKAVTYIKC